MTQAHSRRSTRRFNDDWLFFKGDVAGGQEIGLDDAGWREVMLPHDWSIEGPFSPEGASATGYLPGGVGWYRKTFSLPERADGQRVRLRFDGVYCHSDVWINGQHLGHRPNGFIEFEYDLTEHLLSQGENTIAVRVDHRQFADARWYTGSGINRNVWLSVSGPVHFASWGMTVTTPTVTADNAAVAVAVTVQDHTGAAGWSVEHVLLDAERQTVAQGTGEACSLLVSQPHLWSPDAPSLYTLQTVLRVNGQVVDEEHTRVGLRQFHFDADTGFWLNGETLKMKGVCVHDDAGALGTAVPVKVWERRLRTLKAAGVNALRMSHNPHMPELYDLCDALGLLVQDEAFDEWELGKNKWIAGWNIGTPGKDGPSAFFDVWGETDLRDMIRHHRNHPSIIMWSIGNEIDYPNDPYSHEILDVGTNPQIYGRGFHPEMPHAERLGVIARRLAQIVREEDPTRPVTAALSAALIANEVGFPDALDVVGYNYQEYRYAEDHARYPDRPLYGSENGMRCEFWKAVTDHPFISGQYLWTGIDYLGEAHSWPVRSNGAGLLDLAGLPKAEYFFRQSLWTTAPMVYLGTRDVPKGEDSADLWRHHRADPVWQGMPGTPVRVIVFTNGDSVELFLNEVSLGVKTLADAPEHALWWDVPYQSGTLRAEARDAAGKVAADTQLRTSGPPVRLLAQTDAARLTADGQDLAHVHVAAVDGNGVPVFLADHDVTWTVDGPARLLGLESGDPASHEEYQANHRRLFHGQQLGYVQSTETPGTVTIRLSAFGLTETIVTLTVFSPPQAPLL